MGCQAENLVAFSLPQVSYPKYEKSHHSDVEAVVSHLLMKCLHILSTVTLMQSFTFSQMFHIYKMMSSQSRQQFNMADMVDIIEHTDLIQIQFTHCIEIDGLRQADDFMQSKRRTANFTLLEETIKSEHWETPRQQSLLFKGIIKRVAAPVVTQAEIYLS